MNFLRINRALIVSLLVVPALGLFLSFVYFSFAQSVTCDFGSPISGGECRGYLATAATTTVSTFATGLDNPYGLAFDSSGNLYVANNDDGTIDKITPGGSISTFATGLNAPIHLAFDSSGNLYVADGLDNVVYKITPGGTVSTFATGFNIPQGLAFDSSGILYVSDYSDGNIYKVTPDGTVSTFESGLGYLNGLAFDSSGNLYAAGFGNGVVYEITPGGTVTYFATGFSDGPDGLAFDSSGNLYASGYYDGVVYKVTSDGTVSTFATGFNIPHGLAFDSSGNLYVADGDGIIYKVTPPTPTTWTVPADWNSADNTIEAIGGGGGGCDAVDSDQSCGGGGGAYAKSADLALTPSATVDYSVGAAGAGGLESSGNEPGGNGGDSYFCNSSSNCGSITGTAVVVGAKGGDSSAVPSIGGAGGQAASSTGSTKYSGGVGGSLSNAAWPGGGGGGAAGPLGPGGAGGNETQGSSTTGAPGGGGADNGAAGGSISTITAQGASGGNSGPGGTGGAGGAASSNGSPGTNGGGGGGGGGGAAGGAGGAGTEWDSSHGAGGGGGGGGDGAAADGGNGGLYGGGGGGAGSTGDGGNGAQGIIVITYTPVGSGGATGRIIRLIGGIRLVGGIRLGGSSPMLASSNNVTDGLVGWWKLDDGSGTSAIDSSGNGDTGTVYNSTWVPGTIGGALDVSSGDVDIPNTPNIDLGTTETIAFWIEGTTTSPFDLVVYNDDFTVAGWAIQNDTGDDNEDLYIRVDTTAGMNQVPCYPDLPDVLDGNWHHVVFVLDNGTCTSYEDGVAIGSGTYAVGGGFASTGGDFFLWEFTLDDVRIYNRALSATEVAELYAYR